MQGKVIKCVKNRYSVLTQKNELQWLVEKKYPISLHFRIGDYVKNLAMHPVLEIEYYIKSINFLKDKINELENNNYILIFGEFNDKEKIEEYNTQIKDLKERRDKLEKAIIPYMVKNEMKSKALKYQDRKIYIKNENVYQNLSYKYLNEKLNKFFKNEKKELVDKICLFLKEEREIKINTILIL